MKHCDEYATFKDAQLSRAAIQHEIQDYREGASHFGDIVPESDSIAYWRQFGDQVITRMALILLNVVNHVADCVFTLI